MTAPAAAAAASTVPAASRIVAGVGAAVVLAGCATTPATVAASPRGDDAPVVRQGPVVDIVDGDTFDLADGTRVRLAIVDTPEVHGGIEPCGPEASDFTGAFLAGATVAVLRPDGAPERGGFERLLGEVVRVTDGASLNVALVASGLGRIDERYAKEDPDLTARLRRAEDAAPTPDCLTSAAPDGTTAITDAASRGPVRISDVRADGPGDDVQYGDSEYVELANVGDEPVDLSGWRVEDDDGNGVTIAAGYGIAAGGTFRVHTGPGDNDPSTDRFHAGHRQGYLNNSGGDDLRLIDASGTAVATFRYDA